MKRILRALGRLLLALLLLAAAALAALGLLRWRGLILLSHEADPEQWELFGVDVSSYQGEMGSQELNQALQGRGGGKPDFVQGSVAAGRSEIEHFFQTHTP